MIRIGRGVLAENVDPAIAFALPDRTDIHLFFCGLADPQVPRAVGQQRVRRSHGNHPRLIQPVSRHGRPGLQLSHMRLPAGKPVRVDPQKRLGQRGRIGGGIARDQRVPNPGFTGQKVAQQVICIWHQTALSLCRDRGLPVNPFMGKAL